MKHQIGLVVNVSIPKCFKIWRGWGAQFFLGSTKNATVQEYVTVPK